MTEEMVGETIERKNEKMDWCKVFMWIASICAFVALLFEHFLPQIVVATLAFVGIAILVVIVVFLMDEE